MGHTEPLQEQGLAKEGAEDQGDTDILAPQGDYCEEERGQKGLGQATGGPDGGGKGCSTSAPTCPGPHLGTPIPNSKSLLVLLSQKL